MPQPPLPPELDGFLSQPNPSVIATVRPDGSPHTVATWYLWENGRVLVNMDESRARVQHIRNDPRVSITVLGAEDWYRHVSLLGRVVAIEPDPQLEVIDRISRHYSGEPHSRRDRGRVSAWIEVDSWHAWAGSDAWKS